MSLASLLGDDEHTAKDDAYTRAMKSRKWLIVSAAACFAVWVGQFTPKDFSVLVGDITINERTWRHLTGFGLMYSSFQYAILMVQLWGRYPYLLAERFGLRLLEKASEAQVQIERFTIELSALRGERGAQSSIAALGGPDHLISPEIMSESQRLARIKGLEDRLSRLQTLVDSLPDNPKPTATYQAGEVIIDLMRLGTPAVTALIAYLAIFTR